MGYAQTGKSCSDAIPLGDNYSATINGSGTVWYSAWTFDLPIKVSFTPSSTEATLPDVELDFTCQPGVYEDSILCSLFCPSNEGVAFDMPHKVNLEKEGDSYSISMGKTYRDLLLKTGIDYNVEVFVKVQYHSAGTIALVPDTLFADCMDGGKFIHLGDTIKVQPEDAERHVVLPYIQWRSDSIRYIWEGTSPVTVAVASTCGIDPQDNTDGRIVDWFTMQPGDTVRVTADSVRYYAEFENAQAGMYYGKFYSADAGVLTIERIPLAPPQGNATVINYDESILVHAADTTELYALLRDTMAIRMECSAHQLLRMYIGTTYDFEPSEAIASYVFETEQEGRSLQLRKEEVKSLWAQATSDYLYVRFAGSEDMSLIMRKWRPSDCAKKWSVLTPSVLSISPSGQGMVYYRMHYASWTGGDITLKSGVSQACPIIIGDTCEFPNTGEHVVYSQAIAKGRTVTIPEATIEQWANHIDAEGNLYVRFNTTGSGTMTITSEAYGTQIIEGCDTIFASTKVEKCRTFTYNGKEYTESGVYRDTVPTYGSSCPTVVTIQLTITYDCEAPEAIDQCAGTNSPNAAQKMVERGQVIILRGGKKYNLLGIQIQ